MNLKVNNFIKNFSYTLSSNLLSMIISTLIILIIPKLIGIEDYGYYQLYLFYSTYVGFMHFGWNDGIYLRYGGKHYHDLDKKVFFSQFWMLTIFQLSISFFIYGITDIAVIDRNRIFIIKMTAMCMLIVNIRLMLIYILQGTNRIKEYAQITMMEKILYCLLIALFSLTNLRSYKFLISADIVGKTISLLYAAYCCKDIVFNRLSSFYFNIKETINNINVGIKLMFANIASLFIIGVVRFGIEHSWNVSTFGKVSLTLSISNFMMVFINALGIIMFPVLRRSNKNKLPLIYKSFRTFLMTPLFGLLIVYYPIKIILLIWIPQYKDSINYMAILFPMCVFEGKMALLNNTFLKTLRKEKMILTVNIAAATLSVILTFLSTILIKNLFLAVISIVILSAFRCLLAELILSNILGLSLYKDMLLELVMTIIFISTSWFLTSWYGSLVYILIYIIYLLINKTKIVETANTIYQLVRGNAKKTIH